MRELSIAGCYGRPYATFWATMWISLVELGNAKQIALEKALDAQSDVWLRRLSLERAGARERETGEPSWNHQG